MPNIPVCPPEVAPKESVVDSPAMTDTESLFIPLGDAAAVVHKEATGETTTDTRVLEELAASVIELLTQLHKKNGT